MNNHLFQRFHTGCNYWSSLSGVFMWSNWNAEQVEEDLRMLASKGLKTLRVFPLWSDFQPMKIHYGFASSHEEIRLGEQPRDNTPFGRACIDPVMMARFETFCDLATRHGFELTVMLLTGWMSGRQFKPEPLQERNIYTDPFALKWQVRFVECFVSHFKGRNSIIGWGLGNESNAMSPCPSVEAAYAWTALISKTIRAADPSRPVISGMHSLTVNGAPRGWRIQDQGELTDIMTVHPYSPWVKYCNTDPLLSLKSTSHPVAECDFYSDLTGKPTMIEEIGDLGRAFTNPAGGGLYCRTLLWSAWANETPGMLWWCGFDPQNTDPTPYDWFEFEGDLGLFDADRKPKPAAEAYDAFQKMLAALPPEYRKPPKRKKEALCILSEGQDNWAAALSAHILAKQTGFDMEFSTGSADWPEKDLYLLPCLCGAGPLPGRRWKELLKRVNDDGATLYISLFDGWISSLHQFAGVDLLSRGRWTGDQKIIFCDNGETLALPGDTSFSVCHREGGINTIQSVKLLLEACGCNVLATDSEGHPVFTENRYGKGRVFLLNYGLEMILAKNAGALEATAADFAGIYRQFAPLAERPLLKNKQDRTLCITVHPVDETTVLCIGVNHKFTMLKTAVELNAGYKLSRVLHGEVTQKKNMLNVCLNAGDGFIFELAK